MAIEANSFIIKAKNEKEKIMFRVLLAFAEILSSSIVLIPILLVLGKVLIRNTGRTATYAVFALYLVAVYSLVGLPTVLYIRWDVSLDLVPFTGMSYNMENTLLNVLLFVPLGMFLPILADKYRSLGRTVLFGFAATTLIECLQLFTYRATDINDIITNVAGTIIGYVIARILMKLCPGLDGIAQKEKGYELYLVCGVVFAVMFLIHPFISQFFWTLG